MPGAATGSSPPPASTSSGAATTATSPRSSACRRSSTARPARSTVATLHRASAAEVRAEAIHQLFHSRLMQPARRGASRRPRRALLSRSHRRASRHRIALGDLRRAPLAHQRHRLRRHARVRCSPRASSASRRTASPAAPSPPMATPTTPMSGSRRATATPRLVMFDPAFAGEHIPALLADIKATFHNIFAHPFWLYHPDEADRRFHVSVSVEGGRIDVTHDWQLTPLRRGFLDLKVEHVWRPLLAALKDRDLLPRDWRSVMRLALFCCPTLGDESPCRRRAWRDVGPVAVDIGAVASRCRSCREASPRAARTRFRPSSTRSNPSRGAAGRPRRAAPASCSGFGRRRP